MYSFNVGVNRDKYNTKNELQLNIHDNSSTSGHQVCGLHADTVPP